RKAGRGWFVRGKHRDPHRLGDADHLPLFLPLQRPRLVVRLASRGRGAQSFLMIITRSPLRISLGGGGTDLPSYYEQHGGFLVAAAIDKYVYITVHQTFQQ